MKLKRKNSQGIWESVAPSQKEFDDFKNSSSAQLADKLTKGTVSVIDIDKNKGLFDLTYLTESARQAIAGTAGVNVTPANYGVTNIKIADKSVNAKTTDFFKVSTNLINEKTVSVGKVINAADGTLTDNASYSVTDFIRVVPEGVYTINTADRRAYYTADKAFITSVAVSGTFTVPANAYYMRQVVANPALGVTVRLNKGNVLLPFEKHYEFIPYNQLGDLAIKGTDMINNSVSHEKTNFFSTSSNLFNKRSIIADTAILSDGTLAANNQYNSSDLIIVKPDTPYTAYGAQRIVWYDKDMVFLGNSNAESYNASIGFKSPLKAYYARISIYRLRTDSAQLNEGTVLLPYEVGGSFVKKSVLPPASVGAIELENIDLTDADTGSVSKFNYATKKIKRIYGDRPVIDTNINKVFSKINAFADNKAVIESAKSADIYALYDALMAQYPAYITKAFLGNDSTGLPIYRYDFKPARPTSLITKQAKYLITSGVHPEQASVWTLYNMMNGICNNWQSDELLEALRFNFHFVIIPVVAPWSYDNSSRINSNGVDISRNFPAGWVQGTYIAPPHHLSTYGGTAPLSEPEAQFVNNILLTETDFLGVIDFHNFFDAAGTSNFLWVAAANNFVGNIGMSHIQRMDRKWKKEYAFVNQSYDSFIGRVDIVPGGTLAAQGNALGINGSLTYEINNRVSPDINGNTHDVNTMTMGHEAFVNFLLTFTTELLKNR